MRASLRLRAFMLLGATAIVGCGTDVVVADVVEAGPLDGGGQPCASMTDCPQGQFCDMPACGAAEGNCKSPPSTCAQDTTPFVCGCDGVLYFNDCTRQMAGVAATRDCATAPSLPCEDAATGNCTTTPPAFPCQDSMDCPPVASGVISVCGRVAGSDCTKVTPGLCTVLPTTCPTDNNPLISYASCDGIHTCLNLCEAIAIGKPFQFGGCQ